MFPLCVEELVEITGGRLSLGGMPPLDGELWPVRRIVTRLDDVQTGDVFLSLAGRNDSGSFAAESAMARGAGGVILEGRHAEPWAGCFSVRVDNAERALQRLATWNRRKFRGPLLAVLGDVGKTLLCRLLEHALAEVLPGQMLPAANCLTDTSLSLLELHPSSAFAGLELFGNNLARASQSALCEPTIAVITSTRHAQLDDRVQVQELIETLRVLPHDGWAILNGDDPLLRRVAHETKADVILVGRSQVCDVRADHVACRHDRLTFVVDGQPFSLPIPCRSYLPLALALCAVARVLELDARQVAAAMATFESLPGRCALNRSAVVTTIDDHYGRSPHATIAAMEMLRDVTGPQRRIVVCGEALTDDQGAHLVGDAVVTVCGADLLLACGDGAERVVEAARAAGMKTELAMACPSEQAAQATLRELIQAGDGVLLAGTRSTDLSEAIQAAAVPPSAAALLPA